MLYFSSKREGKEIFFVKKKLYRSRKDRKLAGVCGGLAEYFDIDPTIIRVIWAVLALCYGTGLLIYLVMALVVPVKPDGWNDVIDVDSEVREPREKKEKYKGPEID